MSATCVGPVHVLFRRYFRTALRAGLQSSLLFLALQGASLHAAPFEIAVSPSRFELSAKSGARLGQSLDIHNVGGQATTVALRTLDWSYSENGDISYHDELTPGSCRPWVLLERPTLTVPARSKRSFRFQINPPADAQRGECRFMVAIEGVEPAQQTVIQSGGANLTLPVTGRIAVAVYVMLNGAQAQLELQRIELDPSSGQPVPRVHVSNTGDAHGRLDGALDGIDAQNRRFTLTVEGTPILPGQTRKLTLLPRSEDDKLNAQPVYPLKARGLLDWDRGSFKVDTELK